MLILFWLLLAGQKDSSNGTVEAAKAGARFLFFSHLVHFRLPLPSILQPTFSFIQRLVQDDWHTDRHLASEASTSIAEHIHLQRVNYLWTKRLSYLGKGWTWADVQVGPGLESVQVLTGLNTLSPCCFCESYKFHGVPNDLLLSISVHWGSDPPMAWSCILFIAFQLT